MQGLTNLYGVHIQNFPINSLQRVPLLNITILMLPSGVMAFDMLLSEQSSHVTRFL